MALSLWDLDTPVVAKGVSSADGSGRFILPGFTNGRKCVWDYSYIYVCFPAEEYLICAVCYITDCQVESSSRLLSFPVSLNIVAPRMQMLLLLFALCILMSTRLRSYKRSLRLFRILKPARKFWKPV